MQAAPADDQPARDYVVLYEQSASDSSARDAVEAAGGTVVDENAKIGVATVRSSEPDFKDRAAAQGALVGAASDRPIGTSGPRGPKPEVPGEQPRSCPGGARQAPKAAAQGDPLSSNQWDMQMIGATPGGSYKTQPGSKKVLVGIIDTGVDGNHPDIAPNFVRPLSRNFTTDKPDIDGPCEAEPDKSCNDPADVDEGGHGTHVAGTVGSAINGVGIAGVAPKTGIVNLRAGQDSGYFFLQPTLDALTYAGDHGIDVVNMSYYIDPWLYNCRALPADSPAAQQEQQIIIDATQRALRYAHDKGVTLVAAAGNQDDDLGDPEPESGSPDYPDGSGYLRDADNSCLSLPTEGDHVLVDHLDRAEQAQGVLLQLRHLAARTCPRRAATRATRSARRRATRSWPRGRRRWPRRSRRPTPTKPTYMTDGNNWWRWIQGTSMASPHATGVAALVVAQYGKADARNGGLKLSPDRVERIMRREATNTPCPDPRLFDYPEPNSGDQYTAYCEGSADRNGFYGDGVVNARSVGR